MNVKKIITLLLAFALTLSLAACGSKDDGKGDSDTQGRDRRGDLRPDPGAR